MGGIHRRHRLLLLSSNHFRRLEGDLYPHLAAAVMGGINRRHRRLDGELLRRIILARVRGR
jgi:hypothetical protein